MKKMVKSILLFSVVLGVVSCTIVCGIVSAHPASDMSLSYDVDKQILDVSIVHRVSDLTTHYIYTVIIRKNNVVYQTYNYTGQPTNSSFTYTYDVNASSGDRIEVFTDCNLGGSLTKQLTVTTDENISDTDSLSVESIAYFPIFGIPFIVYLGLITLFVFVLTAGLAILKRRGMISYQIKWHFWLAYVAILLGVIHGILGLVIYF